jgi:hypothetical protein
MAKIWNEIELKWNGESFFITPSLEFINHLESNAGRSLSNLFIRLVNKDLPSSIACEIIGKSLRYAGAEVSDEDVYEATSGGMDSTAIELASSILVGVMPKPKEGEQKKPQKPVKAVKT